VIRTPRLRLVPGTEPMLRAELESPDALGAVIEVRVPESWPPELYDADAVNYMLRWSEANPADAGTWGFYYVLEEHPTDAPLLVGAGGYKGAPDVTGTVEIGYAIVPERRRKGYAREAVDGLLAHAFADARVTRVIAHTLVALEPSIAVLRSASFTFNGAGHDPQEPSAIQYELTRQAYAASLPSRCRVSVG
jgi:[ribosomal protein S5]-alanine N-acetyltransferase